MILRPGFFEMVQRFEWSVIPKSICNYRLMVAADHAESCQNEKVLNVFNNTQIL